MSLPQFTAGCSLHEFTAQYYAAAPETDPTGIQPQMTIGPGGGSGSDPEVEWCRITNALCGLCMTFCDFVPFHNCFRLCDWPCLACRL